MLGNGLLQPAISRLPSAYLGSSTGHVMNGISKDSSNPSVHRSSKPLLSIKLFDNSLHLANKISFKGTLRGTWTGPRAILATDPASTEQLIETFDLDDQSQLQVNIIKSTGESPAKINLQVTNSSPCLVLHWGAVRSGEKNWILPSYCPSGTTNYKKRALRTPFTKSGDKSLLTIEIRDSNIASVEFLLYDESRNNWFKFEGQNFHIDLPRSEGEISQISIPEDLVQVQAYLRWERKGKQMYTPEQEKDEYEAARKDLQDEVAKGVSVEEIRAQLQRGANLGKDSSSQKIPKDTQKKVVDRVGKSTTPQRIQRKKRDVLQILNKFPQKTETVKVSAVERELSALELCSKVMEELDAGSVLQKKIYKLDNKELLVLITNPQGRVRVRVATNMEGPLVLHWGLSKNSAREWAAPPLDIIPEGSSILQLCCETTFREGFALDPSLRSVEIEIGERSFIGMPFVLRSDSNWIKDNGSDFYFSLRKKDIKPVKAQGDGKGTAKQVLDAIAEKESDAERSLMHRFNIATELLKQAKDEGELGLAGILVWMRFMASRQLTWNKNYNVKPREISSAQDRLTDLLEQVFEDQPHNREIVRLIMSTVGRGGQGDVGQRIRDEILVIQRNNDCKGGMMEEWHQKLHNNTSPDDVVICQALLDYIKNDFDIKFYWNTLNSNGVTKERLASYDRQICSEPHFRRDQKEGLIRDLTAYMRTLKAVHSGADLESAIATCMGYSAEGKGFMGGVQIRPISGLSPELPGLLRYVLEHVEDKKVGPLLEGLLEARFELRPSLLKKHDRLKDIIFLDLALDSTVRTAVERGFEELNNAQPSDIIYIISIVLENLCLSSDNNEELIYCIKDWYHTLHLCKSKADQWALYAKAVLDRTRLALTEKAEHYQKILQPSAEYLGGLLGVEQWAINIFTEEMIRAGSAASLSLLLNRLDPILRNIAHLGSWQVISPVEVRGFVVTVDELATVQNKVYEQKTILVARRVKGEEEIPDGVVALLTPDMPDVLSHVSVRARNSKVCFATCFEPNILDDLRSKEGKALSIQPTSSDLVYTEIEDDSVSVASGNSPVDEVFPGISLKKKHFNGTYAISADEFSNELVGAKSRNIAYLKSTFGTSWIRVPESIALPFGVFEKVLSEEMNKDVAEKIAALNLIVAQGDFQKLHDIRETVLQLKAPHQLVDELKNKMKTADMPWPGDEGERRWQQAWMAIKKVWASKWNERAYFSTRKAKIDHNDLCMAVLVQEVVNADYAFVIHTVNPSTEDSSEIYAEVVKGLGETLVGAYPGRAMSFVTKKSDLSSPKILGYPSKPIGLFIKRSIIFRSDSNGEDLEGYAGAGLYDSVPMDEEEKRAIDYSSDLLITDHNFRQSVLSKIALAGFEIEQLYKSPQDVEGVIKNGELYVVQTRPQM
ncbi:alpha-glucan water dikinase, chloroplastic isoform X2 [Cryptomeria japonica]|uniref:alpha-glucan water dikinase, chloroplastic isoform X2 n=1 Tax=Cryptomeria japonica TaxID=3369 RepID=UPI0025ACDA1A|nr:alpha-glucan water dikinase, chloroplastic isoform X2 [Cryptomeria japonica]